MTENVLKFLLSYLSNEEIQSRKIQKNIYRYFEAPFNAEFPCSQDKRAGMSKSFLSLPTLFLYIAYWW